MLSKILLVEDDRTSALLVKKYLEREGYYVFLAGNGLEALEVISKQQMDLVVTDVVMPIMDGVDLYDALRKRPDTQYIPIIIITDKQIFLEAFSALGVEHFVPKGEDFKLLLQKIKTVDREMEKMEYRKILVSGGNALVVEQMRKILVSKRHIVSTANNSMNTLQQAFLMVPHIILLDLRLKDHSDVKELVKSLRSFHVFHNVKILTYSYLTKEEMEYGAAHWQVIEQNMRECEELGGAKFIGNFSQVTFLQTIGEFIKDVAAPPVSA